jgi:hypothetical protein
MPDDEKVDAGGGGISYGILTQKHDDYDARLIEKIEDLYTGGFVLQRKATQYLGALEGEHPVRFQERCRITAYQAYFSQIIDQFTSDVFGQPLSVKPAADADDANTPGELPDEEFYTAFEKNADRKGTSFVDLMLGVLRTALKHKRALIAIDAPKSEGPAPVSLADEEARGTRALYAYECPVARLIDWGVDDETGRYTWCILWDKEHRRQGPRAGKGRVKETFTLWEIADEANARATWQRFEIQYREAEPPSAESIVTMVDEGVTSFARIPILKFELPDGFWIGNKTGPSAIEHWQRRSALLGAEAKSLLAIPYVKRGPQANEVGGPIPADIAGDQSRGNRPQAQFNSKGWLELAAGDEVGIMEPEGKCYALTVQELKELRESMFQVVFQMAASVQRNNTSMGRSGASKKKDEDLTARVLRALGHLIREFSVEVFDTISMARNEDVHWTPHGLDGYDSEDHEQLTQEALVAGQVIDLIPSETFHKAYVRVLAEKFLKNAVDVETMGIIIDELSSGVEAQREIDALEQEARKDAIENPPSLGSQQPLGQAGKRPPVNAKSKKPASDARATDA